jgi:uncharacterized membrane protein YkvA (DUF1232 family)
MSYVLDDKQKKKLKKELKKMKELKNKNFEFSKSDYDEIIPLLEKSPMIQSLAPPDKNNLKYLPEKQGNNYILVEKDEVIKIPEIYNSTIEFAALHGFKAIDKNNFEFRNLILKIIKIILKGRKIKKSFYDKLAEIIDNADKYYQDLREDIKNLEEEHGDKMFELYIIIPDIFVYLMRLLTCNELDEKSKVKIALSIVYIIESIDFIPEYFFGQIGYIEDLYIAIENILYISDDQNLSREIEIKYWPGRIETLDNFRKYYEIICELLEEELINKIKELFKRKSKGNGIIEF